MTSTEWRVRRQASQSYIAEPQDLAFATGVPVLRPSALTLGAHFRTPRAFTRRISVRRRAALLTPTAVAEIPRNHKDVPAWAGGGPLSDFVNILINSPLYVLMRVGARRVLISTAEKKGVMWRDNVRALESAFAHEDRAAALAAITDPDLVYPEYYLQPFHAYVDGEGGGGNLDWFAAFEAPSATLAMCARVWKGEQGLSVTVAAERLRGAHFEAIATAAPGGWASAADFVAVDVGCSVGLSTVDAAKRLAPFRSLEALARVVGLDASPHFLAVAQRALADEDASVQKCVEYIHALGENSKMEAESVNWWSLQFVIHELPSTATRDVFAEAFRVLKPGGVLSLIDNDPQSPVIQGLPPAIATLMKSTGTYRWQATVPFHTFGTSFSDTLFAFVVDICHPTNFCYCP